MCPTNDAAEVQHGRHVGLMAICAQPRLLPCPPCRAHDSAFASDTALVLSHLDCDENPGIPAVQTPPGSLALTDAVVTGIDGHHGRFP